jgi:hypothetical protein
VDLTEQEIIDKITEQKIIKGPWQSIPESHEDKHKRLFNSLIELLLDLDDVVEEVPRDAKGDIDWSKISINFLLQWTSINASKISHDHQKETNVSPI